MTSATPGASERAREIAAECKARGHVPYGYKNFACVLCVAAALAAPADELLVECLATLGEIVNLVGATSREDVAEKVRGALAAAQQEAEQARRALEEAGDALADAEAHAMTCRIVGHGCDCGAAAKRAEVRSDWYRVKRAALGRSRGAAN